MIVAITSTALVAELTRANSSGPAIDPFAFDPQLYPRRILHSLSGLD